MITTWWNGYIVTVPTVYLPDAPDADSRDVVVELPDSLFPCIDQSEAGRLTLMVAVQGHDETRGRYVAHVHVPLDDLITDHLRHRDGLSHDWSHDEILKLEHRRFIAGLKNAAEHFKAEPPR